MNGGDTVDDLGPEEKINSAKPSSWRNWPNSTTRSPAREYSAGAKRPADTHDAGVGDIAHRTVRSEASPTVGASPQNAWRSIRSGAGKVSILLNGPAAA